jgi:hypothetical protein
MARGDWGLKLGSRHSGPTLRHDRQLIDCEIPTSARGEEAQRIIQFPRRKLLVVQRKAINPKQNEIAVDIAFGSFISQPAKSLIKGFDLYLNLRVELSTRTSQHDVP